LRIINIGCQSVKQIYKNKMSQQSTLTAIIRMQESYENRHKLYIGFDSLLT
jgi:uncharacterized protein YeeX (DUF496 family)